MFGHLHIEERGRPSRVVDLIGSATIGRTPDNDIVLDSEGVSHCHAMLLAQPHGVDLVDLGSTFGTYVNAIPAEPDEPVRLVDGAQIRIGRAALRFLAPRATMALPALDTTPAAPPLEAAYLNTRFDWVGSDMPLLVGRSATLRVWVGAPIATDERQSSRPLKVAKTQLASPLALQVQVRTASRNWRIVAEQPSIMAMRWGSAQIAHYTLTALRAERTRLGVRIAHGNTHQLVQHITLGIMASETSNSPVQPQRILVRAVGDVPAGLLPLCRACFAPIRAQARFCPTCGTHL